MKKQKPPISRPNRPAFSVPSTMAANNDLILNNAIALFRRGQFDQSEAMLKEILRFDPQHIDALHLLAMIATVRQNYGTAVEWFDKVLKIAPNYAEAHHNMGVALRGSKQQEAALECFDRALRVKPNYPDAWNNRGVTLFEIKRPQEAVESFDRAIALNPNFAEAFYNRGNALRNLLKNEEALVSYERALRVKPSYAKAANNRGLTLRELGRLDEAIVSYDQALSIEPNNPEVLSNRGIALCEMGRYEEGLEMYTRATGIAPAFVPAIYNRARALSDLHRHEEAVQSYERVIEVKPDYDFIDGTAIYEKLKICDWGNLDRMICRAVDKIENGGKTSYPFSSIAFSCCPRLQKKAADIFVSSEIDQHKTLPKIKPHPRKDKIRIGYFSPDFRNHAIAYLTAGLFEHHDKSTFELTAFSLGYAESDDMRKRVAAAFDRFIDVHAMADRDIALMAREANIDIAVDLAGHTQGGKPGVFALRAAPSQVSYLYAGTIGGDLFDYLIADSTVIPELNRQYYSEKIVYLPQTFQVNDNKRCIAERVFSREELGLPKAGFVFCCFNNNFKIMPGIFDRWMLILKKVECSVLWLFEDNAIASRNLRVEAKSRGVDPERLIFAKKVPLAEHLARHRVADLFLDTLPYNAHTTASDALWAGVPVLTCVGDSFASRVAASLLKAIRLQELIVTTLDDYEAMAIDLATNEEKLNVIKNKLLANRNTTPLFNTELFTRYIEAAYLTVCERNRAGLSPEHIFVQP